VLLQRLPGSEGRTQRMAPGSSSTQTSPTLPAQVDVTRVFVGNPYSPESEPIEWDHRDVSSWHGNMRTAVGG